MRQYARFQKIGLKVWAVGRGSVVRGSTDVNNED